MNFAGKFAVFTRASAGLLLVIACCGTGFVQAQTQDPYAAGMAAFNAHNYSEAAPLFAAAERASPGKSDALLYEGKSLANVNRFAEAEAVLREYSTQHPQSSEALYILGYVLNREDKPKESLNTYTQAARLSTPKSDDLKVVAIDYVMLNDYPDAIRWMKQAVAFDPQNEEAWYGLGRCYYTQSDFPDAEKAFLRALALAPKDLKAATNLALTLEMRNRPKDADAAYKHAIALADADPKTDEWPYLDYASFLLDQGRAADAVPLLRNAVKINPRCADCHGKLGRALEAEGQNKQAVAELEQAVALSPKDPKLHYALGRAYRAAGMEAKAKAELATTAKLYGTKDSTGPK